ncbi:hypothetical protein [Methylobacterium soli]|uniref:Uncharacterized protein n=1 Tax=Methylobacterium soli TaxID=553447 RepID=A0A6L3SSN1_9HYPH|nr:hypothetical protein [Methylobacterium soli]KAB1075430.1 hypothetical protein F6X53_25025 [Methylobacterium soli]GJE41327.1 hypothetical protein AEGHOMDF_0491 [Methylobacterium soli]
MWAQRRDILDVQHCAKTRAAPEPTSLRPEDFDDIIAEQIAQKQALIMMMRRVAALTRMMKLDPAEFAAHWKKVGRQTVDLTALNVAEGHENVVRANAKRRLEAIIDIGMR